MNSLVDVDVTDIYEQVEHCREYVELPEQGNVPWSQVPFKVKLRVLLIERLQQMNAKKHPQE